MQTIDRDELKQRLDRGDDLRLIEVLGEDAFKTFHLPGAINIPLSADDFEERVLAEADKDDLIVVYCKDSGCNASPRAAERIEKLGYERVLDYEAGKDDWRDAGLPVE